MQDTYVGDIGDYGKYGLLRAINKTDLQLAVNWYRVIPREPQKQRDGKFVEYLSSPEEFRHYDSVLFDELRKIVIQNERTLSRIETSGLLRADFFSEELYGERKLWHKKALEKTKNADIVFLDPDNGLETENMFMRGSAKEKHVKYQELKDYYDRGQSVILYQHLARITKQECVEIAFKYNKNYLHADSLLVLEYPRQSPRFYFFFLHEKHVQTIKMAYDSTADSWSGFCKKIIIKVQAAEEKHEESGGAQCHQAKNIWTSLWSSFRDWMKSRTDT